MNTLVKNLIKMSKYYDLKPRTLGCEVIGINFKTENRREVMEDIKKDVTKHLLLFFENQDVISGKRHVEISKWFGELESTFYKHYRSPHPDVFRVSNDESEGCRGVGRTGWHIDGSFQSAPFAYSLYHMVSVPKDGATLFVPLTKIIEGMEPKKREKWDQLWMISDRRAGPVHPLIYKHPITKKPVLCLHLGMTERFLWNYKTPDEKLTSPDETSDILREIYDEITIKNRDIIYKHDWIPGEFIISDNLAVGHEAAPETQYSRDNVGLRVLHRTTIKGVHKPEK